MLNCSSTYYIDSFIRLHSFVMRLFQFWESPNGTSVLRTPCYCFVVAIVCYSDLAIEWITQEKQYPFGFVGTFMRYSSSFPSSRLWTIIHNLRLACALSSKTKDKNKTNKKKISGKTVCRCFLSPLSRIRFRLFYYMDISSDFPIPNKKMAIHWQIVWNCLYVEIIIRSIRNSANLLWIIQRNVSFPCQFLTIKKWMLILLMSIRIADSYKWRMSLGRGGKQTKNKLDRSKYNSGDGNSIWLQGRIWIFRMAGRHIPSDVNKKEEKRRERERTSQQQQQTATNDKKKCEYLLLAL